MRPPFRFGPWAFFLPQSGQFAPRPVQPDFDCADRQLQSFSDLGFGTVIPVTHDDGSPIRFRPGVSTSLAFVRAVHCASFPIQGLRICIGQIQVFFIFFRSIEIMENLRRRRRSMQ